MKTNSIGECRHYVYGNRRYYVLDISGTETNSLIRDQKMFRDYVYSLAGKTIVVYGKDDREEIITFAREKDRTVKNKKNAHPVLGKLAYAKGDTRRATIVHIEKAVKLSKWESENSESTHGWLDERGWERRRLFVFDGAKIYPADLSIGKAKDGRNILYTINIDIKKGVDADKDTADGGYVSTSSPNNDTVSQEMQAVNSEKLCYKTNE